MLKELYINATTLDNTLLLPSKGNNTLGPASVLLDIIPERLTRVQWEPCAHAGRLIAGLLMTVKNWKQPTFINRRMHAK